MLHQTGNTPRDNRSAEEMLEIFRLPHPLPAYNQEAWYIATDTPDERAWNREIMYGSLLSGGLAGVSYEAYGMTRGNRESGIPARSGTQDCERRQQRQSYRRGGAASSGARQPRLELLRRTVSEHVGGRDVEVRR